MALAGKWNLEKKSITWTPLGVFNSEKHNKVKYQCIFEHVKVGLLLLPSLTHFIWIVVSNLSASQMGGIITKESLTQITMN